MDQVPPIAERISEDGNMAIGCVARRAYEAETACLHLCVIFVEIIRLQEQPDAPAALVADGGALPFIDCAGQQERGLCAFRGDPQPTLGAAKIGVFQQIKAQRPRKERDGAVIVGDKTRNKRQVLWHENGLSPSVMVPRSEGAGWSLL
ncbi:hypothetical protein LOKVESSMR4R_00982 [Yoonia vestfoldensis]|jgi:hypothetical protein|uniref:Uncharacterized protein n=1 Tax=Yoonia vestfoldensis TaxID=245188 RepID=A0A1Y0EAD3_9RHOB|nr:hypothetical protein LOKVESSMR4R_00982 [Yoonia vestfoldensis]